MRGNLNAISKKLQAMREVSVIMHYAVHDHEDIISPNSLSLPSITDTIDVRSLETMRSLWLKAASKEEVKPVDIQESTLNKFERLLAQAMVSVFQSSKEHFIRAAAYPVPSEYMVLLPVRSNMRAEIIGNLVPFEKTRDMLLSLEEKLESPMRILQIGHVPVNGGEKLKMTMDHLSRSGEFRPN